METPPCKTIKMKCEPCNFESDVKCNFERHMTTQKHFDKVHPPTTTTIVADDDAPHDMSPATTTTIVADDDDMS